MSQQIWATINPETTSGTMLAAILTDFKDALMSGMAGTTRPTQLQAGGIWIDTTNQAAPNYYWSYKLWTGTVDLEVFRINILSGIGGSLTADSLFEVNQISADTVGAVKELIKQRFANNGQVLSGDTIGEIRFIGRTNTSTDPVVGYIKWTSTDAETASIFGGTLSFYSTPDASSTISEHLKFIDGLVEVPVPLLVNALRPVSQDIATATSIVQLSAAKNFVEFTGSTTTAVRGINSGHDSREVTIHNRSTAYVTLDHQHTSAAAADRLNLPNDKDYAIEPEATITLFYCTAESRWKIKSSVLIGISQTKEIVTGLFSKWTVPANITRIYVTSFRQKKHIFNHASFVVLKDTYGNFYSWGSNSTDGELGQGDTLNHSSPIAVLGGFQFETMAINEYGGALQKGLALTKDGVAYAWGNNTSGALGLGDVNPRSSPVAVLGGFKFRALYNDRLVSMGLTTDGALYAWGVNTDGQLGLGDVTSRSSPVAVLGGLKFSEVWLYCNASTGASVLAMTKDGVMYAWGNNAKGQLGLGDIVPRSSPVAVLVLGGQRLKKIGINGNGTANATSYALTDGGVVYAWGTNVNGQLGLGDVVARSSPVAVLGGLTFKDFWTVGETNIIGKTGASSYYGWGQNVKGCLGVGDIIPRSSPVAMLGGLDFADLTTGVDRVFGIQEDGKLYSWGTGTNFALGLGDLVGRSSPVAVLGGLKFTEVATANVDNSHSTHALDRHGNLYGWGENTLGLLGVGDLVDRSSPVLVLGAFGNNPTYNTNQTSIEVTPSTEYLIRLGRGIGYFGNTPLGSDIEKIAIEYVKRGN